MKYKNVKIDPDFIRGLFIFNGFKYNSKFKEYPLFKNELELKNYGLCMDSTSSYLDFIKVFIKVFIKPSQCSLAPNCYYLDANIPYNIDVGDYFITFDSPNEKIRIPITLRSYYKYMLEKLLKLSLKVEEITYKEDDEYSLIIPDICKLKVSLYNNEGLLVKLGVVRFIDLYDDSIVITWANVDYSCNRPMLITNEVLYMEYANIDYFRIEEEDGFFYLKIVEIK